MESTQYITTFYSFDSIRKLTGVSWAISTIMAHYRKYLGYTRNALSNWDYQVLPSDTDHTCHL